MPSGMLLTITAAQTYVSCIHNVSLICPHTQEHRHAHTHSHTHAHIFWQLLCVVFPHNRLTASKRYKEIMLNRNNFLLITVQRYNKLLQLFI